MFTTVIALCTGERVTKISIKTQQPQTLSKQQDLKWFDQAGALEMTRLEA